MANTPSPNDLTRQQLDELDALLQRMLSLPQTPAEAPAPPVGWRADRPATDQPSRTPHLATTVVMPEPVVAERVAGVARANALAFAPSPVGAVPTIPEAYPEAESAPEPTPTQVTPALVAPTPAEPIAAPVHAPQEVVAVDKPEPGPIELTTAAHESSAPIVEELPVTGAIPAGLWPVFALNWVIEKTLGFFGPPGMALTTPAVKYVLGSVGILLMIGAGLWTARGMGLVKLPMP